MVVDPDAPRQPICRACVERQNAQRREMGSRRSGSPLARMRRRKSLRTWLDTVDPHRPSGKRRARNPGR
jgi:hypothetical protein